jgi:RND family efflux transporter MFP subunit
MNPRTRSTFFMVAVLTAIGVIIGLLVLRVNAGEKPAAPNPPEPATVAKPAKEADLNIVTLTPEAAESIGVKTAKIIREPRQRTLTLPGEVVLPPGHSVVVTAPVAGTIRLPVPATQPASAQPAAAAATAPSLIMPGTKVNSGAPVLALVPELTAEARATIATALVDAEGQVRNAHVQQKAAQIALERARKLFDDQAGTQRAVDEAQAAFDIAEQAVKAAEARKAQLARASGSMDDGSATPLPILSPIVGVVTAVRVTPGQVVAAGAPLFEVADPSKFWVRAIAGASDAAAIASSRPATILRLGELAKRDAADRAGFAAEPTGAPPIGTPLTSSIDLTYKLTNPAAASLIPGERIAVVVPLRDEEQSLVVPWSAVVFDIHGGSWVYEVVGARQFARRRVEVRNVDRGEAILRGGPGQGTEILTQGAVQVFGREMGYAK